MRILVNMPSQYAGKPSGVSRVAFSLIEQLLRETVHEYVLRSPWTYDQLPQALKNDSRLSLEVVPRPKIMVFDVLRQAFVMPFVCRKLGIDVILNIDPFGSPTGGKRRLTIVHDLYFKTIPELIGARAALTTDLIFRFVLRGSDEIICVSDATRDDLSRWYPSTKGKSITIHSDSTLSIDMKDISEISTVDSPYILAVGNGTSNKNFATLAQAFAEIAPKYPSLKLVHVGKDDGEEILGILKDHGLDQRLVRVHGIDDLSLATLYRHATCLCVPSTYEGFCLPVLEAQSFGCPVICANRSATPEIAGAGAITFDPSSVLGLTGALNQLLGNENLAEQLRTSGYENRKRFSWKKAASAYAVVFERSPISNHDNSGR